MGFSKLKINGNCDVNYTWSKKADLTTEYVESIAQNGIYIPEWDGDTIMLATFSNTLNASNISGTIYGYLIHRQKSNETVRYKIAEVNSTITNIKDFNIGNRATYQYFITPIYMNDGVKSLGEPILTDSIQTDFNSWSVIGLAPTTDENVFVVDVDNIWSFYIDIDGGTFSVNEDKTITTGLGKFPKTYVGETNYITGSLSCLIGNVSCEGKYYDDDIEKLEKWRNFCNNGKLKLLKDRKGHIIPCEITDVSYENDDKFDELQSSISFNFTQLEDSKNISAYSIENI